MNESQELSRSNAEWVLGESYRVKIVISAVLGWAIAIIGFFDAELPLISKILLCFVLGLVTGLFSQVWYLSKRLRAAIALIRIANV